MSDQTFLTHVGKCEISQKLLKFSQKLEKNHVNVMNVCEIGRPPLRWHFCELLAKHILWTSINLQSERML